MTTLREVRVTRYIVTASRAEVVSDRTSQRHRLLVVDDAGDVTIRLSAGGRIIAAMSAAELRPVVRERRRELRRRWLDRLLRRPS